VWRRGDREVREIAEREESSGVGVRDGGMCFVCLS
jgi:hypothetical protein